MTEADPFPWGDAARWSPDVGWNPSPSDRMDELLGRIADLDAPWELDELLGSSADLDEPYEPPEPDEPPLVIAAEPLDRMDELLRRIDELDEPVAVGIPDQSPEPPPLPPGEPVGLLGGSTVDGRPLSWMQTGGVLWTDPAEGYWHGDTELVADARRYRRGLPLPDNLVIHAAVAVWVLGTGAQVSSGTRKAAALGMSLLRRM